MMKWPWKASRYKVNRTRYSYIQPNLNNNLMRITQELGASPDVIIREFQIGQPVTRVAAIYTDGLVDKDLVSQFINRTLKINSNETISEVPEPPGKMFDYIKENALMTDQLKVMRDWDEMILSILSGDTALLIDGWTQAIIGGTKGGETRSISEPTTQVVIRGPKDSFNESIATNISLIRRRIKSPNLWLDTMRVGRVTQTSVAIMYIKGIVNDDLVREITQRIKGIEIDGVLESGYIEEFIQDQTFTPFPMLYNTERPDSVAGNLLSGKVAILVDGSPFVMIAPTLFVQFFQAPSDYYSRFDIATFLRLLRYISFLVSLTAPSLYIAAITFHQEMIPTTLLISLAASREGVPFPAFVEALLMEASFEVLREAGIRMPRAVGQAVSIVGALVLGQAAVQAGIVSPAMVIIVAITGIASFSTPSYDLAISARMIRFVLMILSASFGLYGITLGLIIMIAHLTSLRSFGIPYMAPLAPFILADQKDAIFRFPLWSFKSRPRLISQKNITRTGNNQQPSPPNNRRNHRGLE
ncbi:spore germination protein [Brevibacillus ginsengisoli]|uniref:spore germination protein n=1 Tax=Brevibacillus ginsengisoli TaxID=363854 RepID=UPI003CEC239C